MQCLGQEPAGMAIDIRRRIFINAVLKNFYQIDI
jgi:hypothetical protein